MQVKLDTHRNNQSFTAFKLVRGAEYTLNSVLKPKDWATLNKIIDSQASNPVDVYLFGYNGKKFCANISANSKYVKDLSIEQWTLFESAISFFRRVAKKADAIQAKIEAMSDVDTKKIF